MNDNSNHQPSGFFYRKEVITWILRIFYVCCALLAAIDFFIHRHVERDFENIPTFYAIYGLVSCVILVVIAKWMRILLIKEENYYDEPEPAEDFLENQGLELPETYNNTADSNTVEKGEHDK